MDIKHPKEKRMTAPTKEESQLCMKKGAEHALVEYNKNIISSWLERATPFAKIRNIGPEYAEIVVSTGNKAKIFGLCFGKTYRGPRMLKINPLCLDAFGKVDICEIEKIRLIGFFAEHMDDIEKDLIGTYKARRLYGAWSRAWNTM